MGTTLGPLVGHYLDHFGAVFGDLEQEHSFHTLNMDYYVKEVISDIDNLFFKNKEGTAYGTNPAMKNALKDAIENPYKVKSWNDIITEFNGKIRESLNCIISRSPENQLFNELIAYIDIYTQLLSENIELKHSLQAK